MRKTFMALALASLAGASLALLPGRVSTLTNLGATRLKLGRPQEAVDLLSAGRSVQPLACTREAAIVAVSTRLVSANLTAAMRAMTGPSRGAFLGTPLRVNPEKSRR